jgi:hypothetical protein
MLTYDTVTQLDTLADTLPSYEGHYATRRLATLVSCTVSGKAAMQRALDAFGDAERGTYSAGYADGAQLALDMIKVIEEALATYIGTQVKP